VNLVTGQKWVRLRAWWWKSHEYCRCGDHRDFHAHHRMGTECSLCPCTRFRREGWWRVNHLIGIFFILVAIALFIWGLTPYGP
jgi:hypothetical protein